MAIEDLIQDLRNAKGPDRKLDVAIALLIGYRRKVETVDGGGQPVERVIWLVPSGDDAGKIPVFTRSVDHAIELAEIIRPNHVGGCSWEWGMGSARIDDGPYCQGANPAIALCIAALLAKLNSTP